MIRIPNGLANFSDVRADNCFYLDRTQYIEQLEIYASRFSMYLRPRRFGKSLFISILEHYYDVNKAGDFSMLFGDLYIGKQPTSLANQFMILRFDFSGIETNEVKTVHESFLMKVKEGFRNFMTTVQALPGNDWTFQMPNYVIKKLYYDYFAALSLGMDYNNLTHLIRESLRKWVWQGQIDDFIKHEILLELKYIKKEDALKWVDKDEKMVDPPASANPPVGTPAKKGRKPKQVASPVPTPTPVIPANPPVKSLLEHVSEKGAAQLADYMTADYFNRPNLLAYCLVFVGSESKKVLPYRPN